jgi:hypothetical protein
MTTDVCDLREPQPQTMDILDVAIQVGEVREGQPFVLKI